jgi:hypothetical protein
MPRSEASTVDVVAGMETLRSGGKLTNEGLAALARVMGVDAGLVERLGSSLGVTRPLPPPYRPS